MLSKTCDRCDAELVFERAQAGQKVECPHCGDMNLVPEWAQEGQGQAERTRTTKGGDEKEKVLLTLRPAMARAHPVRFVLLWAGVLGGTGGAIWFAAGERQGLAVGLAGLAAVCVVWLGVWKVLTFSLKLEVTNVRTIRSAGLLSRSTSEVLHENIRNFQIDQSLTDRLLNVGQIGISSSGQDEVEIVAGDVPRPYEMKKLIDGFREMKA